MADEDQQANYELPASQVDLEQRQKDGNASSRVLSTADVAAPVVPDDEGRSFEVEGNDLSGYRGTSQEYMTYANETEKPLRAEGGPESVLEEVAYAEPDLAKSETDPNVVSGDDASEESNSEDDEDSGSSSSTPRQTASKKAAASRESS